MTLSLMIVVLHYRGLDDTLECLTTLGRQACAHVADLGARAVAADFRLYCDVAARIQHKESQSFGGRRKPIKTYYGLRNMLLYWEKHERRQRTSSSSQCD